MTFSLLHRLHNVETLPLLWSACDTHTHINIMMFERNVMGDSVALIQYKHLMLDYSVRFAHSFCTSSVSVSTNRRIFIRYHSTHREHTQNVPLFWNLWLGRSCAILLRALRAINATVTLHTVAALKSLNAKFVNKITYFDYETWWKRHVTRVCARAPYACFG